MGFNLRRGFSERGRGAYKGRMRVWREKPSSQGMLLQNVPWDQEAWTEWALGPLKKQGHDHRTQGGMPNWENSGYKLQ